MPTRQKNSILIVIDLINDIIHTEGKIPSCAKYVEKYNVIEHVNKYIAEARDSNIPIIHVKVAFSSNYLELPKNSPIFKNAEKFQALKLGSWGTEFHKDVDVKDNDFILVKHRISSFYGTDLETVLRANKIDTLYIAGVSTNMAVELTAREAHDRDYNIIVLSDACGSRTKELHDFSLSIISGIAEVV